MESFYAYTHQNEILMCTLFNLVQETCLKYIEKVFQKLGCAETKAGIFDRTKIKKLIDDKNVYKHKIAIGMCNGRVYLCRE